MYFVELLKRWRVNNIGEEVGLDSSTPTRAEQAHELDRPRLIGRENGIGREKNSNVGEI